MATATSQTGQNKLKNAEDCSSAVLVIYSKMSCRDEELIGPIKVEGVTLEGVRRELKVRKKHKKGAVYILLVAKLEDKEKKNESEERLRKHLQSIIKEALKSGNSDSGTRNTEANKVAQSRSDASDCEPEPKKVKLADETILKDFVIPVYIGETGKAIDRFSDHHAVAMFFKRFESHYRKYNYGLFLWLAPNPKSLACFKEKLFLESYNFALNHSENKKTRVKLDTSDSADPIIQSEKNDRKLVVLSEEEAKQLNDLPGTLDQGREVFKTLVITEQHR